MSNPNHPNLSSAPPILTISRSDQPPPPYTEFFSTAGPSNHNPALLPSPSGYPQAQYLQAQYPQPPPPHVQPHAHVYTNPNPYQQPPPPRVAFAPPAGAHSHFGPTPINDRQVLLPYTFYGERAAVDARTRWRFWEALFWAVGIYVGIAFLVGVEGVGDGWWTIDFLARRRATI